MKFGCKCLNFIVEVQNNLNKINVEITAIEASHNYFQKDVLQLTGNVNSKTEVYPSLVKSQVLGSWNIYKCFSCHIFTNATNYVTGLETCSSNLEEILDLKLAGRNEKRSYSKVFQICIPTTLSIPENFIFTNSYYEILGQRVVDQIERKASEFFKMAELKYQGCSEEQMLCLEDVKRRVLCEKKFILELLMKAKSEIVCQSSSMEDEYLMPSSSHTLTEFDPEDDLKSHFQKLKVTGKKQKKRLKYEDIEGMFAMDEDDIVTHDKNNDTPSENEQSSDTDTEEEIFERDYSEIPKEFIARSVPLDIPTLSLSYSKRDNSINDSVPMEPQAIAASMKEMARNMRLSSVDVFGDLPRRPPPKDDKYYNL